MSKQDPKCRKCGACDRDKHNKCRPCNKASGAAYRARNPIKIKQASAVWRAANPEKIKAYKAEYRAANSENIKASRAGWHAANPGKAAQKTPPPKSPLAQPSAAPVADAENPKPKTAQNSRAVRAQAKAKLSAKDAQLGIAEAMRGIEAPPADGAVTVLPAAHKFTKGQQVKVTTVSVERDVWRQKYEGKTGKVDGTTYGGLYVVNFKGRTGGVADFTADELESAST